jgi:hypothetical protein
MRPGIRDYNNCRAGRQMDVPKEKRSRVFTRRIALLSMLVTSPIFILFVCLKRFDQGLGVWICSGIVVGSIMIWWDLRKSVWFWVAITVAVLLQIPFVLFVPWADRYMSFVSLLPFGFLDFVIVYGCIKLSEKGEKRSGGLHNLPVD